MDFLSFPGGLRTVIDRMLTDLPVEVRLSTTVTAIDRSPAPGGDSATPRGDCGDRVHRGYLLRTSSGIVAADAVVLAVPAWAASALMRPLAPRAADTLAQTRTASTVSVLLGFPRAAVADIPACAGNGLLVPSTSGTLLKAITNLSAKWPQYAGGETYLMRLSAGRDGADRVGALDDAELVDHLRRDLRRLTGPDVAPTLVHVQRWRRGLPQLTVGHVDRIAAVRAELGSALPGVQLAGASYDGIGLAACIGSGERAAQAIAGPPPLDPSATPVAPGRRPAVPQRAPVIATTRRAL